MPKSAKGPGLALTPRDLQILWSLHQARYLTVESIEWLHFPQWRERYGQWQEQQRTGKAQRYKACSQAYTRMQLLAQAGYVRRIVRPVMLAIDHYQREADMFLLAEPGARLLAEYHGLDLNQIH
jgi:hypothetical protein